MTNARKSKVSDAQIVSLIKHSTAVGDLVVFQGEEANQFTPSRAYFLYDIPAKAERGGHAHKELEQTIIALSGAFDVVLDDGQTQSITTLNQPTVGLTLPPGLWRELKGFSGGAICLVLASLPYDEEDYIRDFDDFRAWKDQTQGNSDEQSI